MEETNTAYSSYTLKHLAEDYMDELEAVDGYYIANGAFMCAAHFMGFQLKQKYPGNPNGLINFSSKSPIIRWSNLRQEQEVTAKSIRELDRLERLLGVPRSKLVSSHSQLV